MAVFTMNDIKKNHKEKKEIQTSLPKDKTAEMEEKIAQAKSHGKEEIEAFIEAFNVFKDSISDLVLFDGTSKTLDQLFFETTIDYYMKPILSGKPVPTMDQETYDEVRKTMFTRLIAKYCK